MQINPQATPKFGKWTPAQTQALSSDLQQELATSASSDVEKAFGLYERNRTDADAYGRKRDELKADLEEDMGLSKQGKMQRLQDHSEASTLAKMSEEGAKAWAERLQESIQTPEDARAVLSKMRDSALAFGDDLFYGVASHLGVKDPRFVFERPYRQTDL